MAPEFVRAMVEARSNTWSLEAELQDTPWWRIRRRATICRQLAHSRRHEQQAMHMLGADVSWPFEYWQPH